MTAAPFVYVIVLNWNRWGETRACIESLLELDYPRFRILIVDNGSTDGSEARLRALFPDLEVMQTGANLGYAGGNNVGIRRAIEADTDYVWILNNDTRVAPKTLTALVDSSRVAAEFGAVATRTVRDDGWNPAVAFTSSDGGWVGIECEGCVEAGPYHIADRLQGGSLLLSTAALKRVGPFDEDYFHYYEDIDLADRIAQAGWQLGFACRATVVHRTGKSLFSGSPQAQYYEIRNGLLYRQKVHGERAWTVLRRNPRLLRRALSVRRALRLDFRQTIVGVMAVTDAVRGRGGQRDFGPSFR